MQERGTQKEKERTEKTVMPIDAIAMDPATATTPVSVQGKDNDNEKEIYDEEEEKNEQEKSLYEKYHMAKVHVRCSADFAAVEK